MTVPNDPTAGRSTGTSPEPEPELEPKQELMGGSDLENRRRALADPSRAEHPDDAPGDVTAGRSAHTGWNVEQDPTWARPVRSRTRSDPPASP